MSLAIQLVHIPHIFLDAIIVIIIIFAPTDSLLLSTLPLSSPRYSASFVPPTLPPARPHTTIYSLQNEPKSPLRSLSRYSLTNTHSTLNRLSPLKLFVQPHQHKSEHGSCDDADEGSSTIDAHSDDVPWACGLRVHVASVDGAGIADCVDRCEGGGALEMHIG